MAAALTLLLIGSLLQGALSKQFQITLPQTISALRGSCVTIPCSFDVEDKYESNLQDNTCKAVWKTDEHTVVFDSSDPQQSTIKGEFTGNLRRKDCTTTLNNMQSEHRKTYFFRADCNNDLKWNFKEKTVEISISDNPPTPTLSRSTLIVKEGTSVSLSCSVPAPCLSHPPTLTWTPGLGDSQETLLENQDKTEVKTSFLTFTASYQHHRQKISCTAVYTKQDGSTESSVSSLTADIQYSPKHTTVSVSPSGPVPEHSMVTLTCSSSANPAVWRYTWYRADRGLETVIGTRQVLNTEASQVSSRFFCTAENHLGPQRSSINQIDVQYSPKHTTVSVSPPGPVPEDSDVTLTCSSSANPAVRNYTWYRAYNGQETFLGTGRVLNIRASKVSRPFFCKAENVLGAGRSNTTLIDVQFAPHILSSSECTKSADQLNCSCETVGNPPPALQWYLDGSLVNHSDKFAISSDHLNNTGLRIIITVNQPQERDLSTLLCRSSNSLGSANQQFYVYFFETQTSADSQDHVMLTVFITTVAVLLVLVCALLLVIRSQRTRHNLPKGTVAMSELPTSPEENEVPDTAEEDIYANANVQRQAGVASPTAISEPNNAEGASGSSGKKNAEGCDVVYSSVNYKIKKKKEKDTVDMDQPGNSYLEEEKCMVGGMGKNFVSNALEMGNLYDEAVPRNVKKEVECEYAQVKFKNRSAMQE